jgi:hypothetical protein
MVVTMAVSALLAFDAEAARRLRTPCEVEGRFLVPGGSTVLVIGGDPPAVSIEKGCAPTRSKVKCSKKGVAVMVRWRSCPAGWKRLTARMAGPDAETLVGRLHRGRGRPQPLTASRSRCGDGVLDAQRGEECDGSDLGGATCDRACETGGTVVCSPDCRVDHTACWCCGNGRLDPGEECDGVQACPASGFCEECRCAPCDLPAASEGCCGPERITLVSTAGTLQVDNLAAFPFPAGVATTMDVGAACSGCRHDVVVPAGGFFVPNFDLPALNFCSSVTPTGCQTGEGLGAGTLWDGGAPVGTARTNVTKSADTADGVCDPTPIVKGTCGAGPKAGLACVTNDDCPGAACNGTNCATVGGVGANTLGDVDSSLSLSASAGVRSALDIKVHSLTWSDITCQPATNPGCCPGSTYDPSEGDLLITEFDFILSPTTDVATGAFVGKNVDGGAMGGCRRAGSGFDNIPPGLDGPKSLTGTPALGPCCEVGQATTVVSVGVGFSGAGPLFDLGFKSLIPNTVAACGAYPADPQTCVVTTDPCLQ